MARLVIEVRKSAPDYNRGETRFCLDPSIDERVGDISVWGGELPFCWGEGLDS